MHATHERKNIVANNTGIITFTLDMAATKFQNENLMHKSIQGRAHDRRDRSGLDPPPAVYAGSE